VLHVKGVGSIPSISNNMNKYLKIDLEKRLLFKTLEIQKICLKLFFLNKKLPKILRLYSFFLLNNISKNSLKIRTENRCLLTERSSGIFSFFSLSRIMIRREGTLGNIPGLRKQSW
jgi:small subunit ribosomal protein S14